MKTLLFRKLNDDRGYSLIEVIVVVSIMAIALGIISLSVSVMFSKDSEHVAKIIDDELSETRMLSMSKAGQYKMIIHIDNNDTGSSSVEIIKDGTESIKTVAIKEKSTISVNYGTNTVPSGSAKTADVTFEFDKGNGSVTTPMTTGTCSITVTSKKLTSKTTTVDLVAASGRHYVRK